MNTKGTCHTVFIILVSVLSRHLVCDSARQSKQQTEHLKELSLFLLGFLWQDIQSYTADRYCL